MRKFKFIAEFLFLYIMERENSLFQDFFTKWKSYNSAVNLKYALTQDEELNPKIKKENPLLNFNLKERYSGLHYDENEIFNTIGKFKKK